MAIAKAIREMSPPALRQIGTSSKGKERKTYSEPEIVALGHAVRVIEDPQNKVIQMVFENAYHKRHAAVYDLDD